VAALERSDGRKRRSAQLDVAIVAYGVSISPIGR
jgi:hypothetical protein